MPSRGSGEKRLIQVAPATSIARLLVKRFAAIAAMAAFIAPVCPAQGRLDSASEGRKQLAVPHSVAAQHNHPEMASGDAERHLARGLVLRKELNSRSLQIAIGLFSESAVEFSALGMRQKAGQAELELGDTYEMMSRYRDALAAYRRAATLGEDHPLVHCAALGHISRTYANIGRLSDATRYSNRALALCGTTPDKELLADLLEAQGEVQFWSSNLADAGKSFTRALQLTREARNSESEALNSLMLAQALNTDDRERARQLAQDALSLWLAAGDLYGGARAHMVLAFMASGEGNFGVAQCHCKQALPVFQRVTDSDNAAVALNVMGMLARQSGDVESSLNYYRQARQDFVAAQDELGEAESITGMADDLVSRRNYRGLLTLYTRKLSLAKSTGNPALLASAMVDIATAYRFERKYSSSEAYFQKGLEQYRAAGNPYGESTTLMRFAELRTEQRKFEQALDLLDQAQKLKEETGEVEDLARIQYLRARVLLLLDRPAEARSEIEKTVAIIESQRLRIPKYDSRADYFASVHEYYSFYIHVLMVLHQLNPGEHYDQLAFEAAEKSKVRSLLDLLENSTLPPSCDELLARERNLKPPQSEDTPSPALQNISAHSMALPEVQAEIADDDTVLLEYALGDDRSYAWLVDRSSISSFIVAPAGQVRAQAQAFRSGLGVRAALDHETTTEYLRRRRAAELEQSHRSRELAELLLGPLKLPRRKRLLVVPDGPLQYIPFAALPVGGRARNSALLASEYELTVLPSASALESLRNAAARRIPPTEDVAIFADPVFEVNANDSKNAIDTRGRSRDLDRALQDSSGWKHIPSLPGSRTEALSIRRIVGAKNTHLALGFDVNRQSVLDGSLERYRILHFATHGIVDTRHPERSGLILSLVNARGEHQDGYLRLSDIYSLKLNADLVVLSSCESALGKDLESEGTIGLPRGFLYAGARSVIASLWKVDDDATAILMKTLYSKMQEGQSASAALHHAQMDLAKDDRFSDPYYWAAFVVEGDYK